MARPRSKGKRGKAGRLSRAIAALVERNPPAQHILDLRELFSFVPTTKGGNIDQDICDGIGQFQVLGLLDGHSIDAKDLRDAGRFWGNHYASLLNGVGGAKVASFERVSRSNSPVRETRDDVRWDSMSAALTDRQRFALIELLVDPLVGLGGEHFTPWWQAKIDEALWMKHKRIRKGLVRMPGAEDHYKFGDAIEGLFQLYDNWIGSRWERAA